MQALSVKILVRRGLSGRDSRGSSHMIFLIMAQSIDTVSAQSISTPVTEISSDDSQFYTSDNSERSNSTTPTYLSTHTVRQCDTQFSIVSKVHMATEPFLKG